MTEGGGRGDPEDERAARQLDATAGATAVIDRIAEAVSVVNAAGEHVHLNAAAQAIRDRLGTRSGGGPIVAGTWPVVDTGGAPVAREQMPVEVTRRTGRAVTAVTLGFRARDGDLVWLRTSTRRLTDGPPPYWVVASFSDVTAEREMGERLRRSDELFATAFEGAAIGMALVATDGRWLKVNAALCALVGYAKDDLLAITFQDITHREDLDTDLGFVSECLAGKRDGYRLHKRYVRADDSVIWALLTVSVVRHADGSPALFVSQVQDISEQRRLEEQLRHLAEHDALTGLPNRRRFDEELSGQLARCAAGGERAALVMLDLDGFKAVNDRAGHDAGDRLLKDVAWALRDRLRTSDLLARLGGDEFAAILVGLEAADAAAVASELIAAVRAVAGPEATGPDGVSASAGVVALGPTGAGGDALSRADRALYRAKEAGRGRVVVSRPPAA